MGLLDAAIGIGLGAYGQKPEVPGYTPVDPTAAAGKAAQGNLANFGDISSLVTKNNNFNADNWSSMLEKMIPGYGGMAKSAGANISSELNGQIPKDVMDAIQTNSAARSLTGGFGGTGMAGNLVARDLGLTSLNLTQQGQSSMESWSSRMASMLAPGSINASSMFITPQTQIASEFENNSNKFQTQWLTNQISAMPDPDMVALSSGLGQEANSATSALGSYMGAGSGGGGGGGSM